MMEIIKNLVDLKCQTIIDHPLAIRKKYKKYICTCHDLLNDSDLSEL